MVDAGQGVEAQSVANCYTAIEMGLEVMPVLNKMDLPQAEPERVKVEIEEIIGIDATDAALVPNQAWESKKSWKPWSPRCRHQKAILMRLCGAIITHGSTLSWRCS